MTPTELCVRLLQYGRQGDLGAIAAMPGAGVHAAVLRIADVHRNDVHAFFRALSPEDHAPFLKALAVYEDSVNGIGSVTLLRDLLPKVSDPNHELFDWILRNTRSYWYYSHNASSYETYLHKSQWRAERAAANIQRDQERQAKDRDRIAVQATANLYNAVRRGDIKAVKALLQKGADPKSPTPEGELLQSFALRTNRPDIAVVLSEPSPPENAL